MPFGKYADFAACVADQSKDHDVESAKAICGKMQATMGGSNFVEYSLDTAGDLYLKYYFADNSQTINESAVGRFSVGDQALEAADSEAIGLPFSILPRKELALKADFHPWHPKENATLDDHIAFARHYSPGHIVAMTKDSNLVSAAMSDIKSHNGRLAVVKITDPKAKEAYLKDPSLIPRQVSPGFMNLEAPNLNGINKVKWAHLAAVPKGAYGDKATLYASCIGGNECINHLVAASVKELDETLSKSYCPVGASESLSSLGNFSSNSVLMSDNANTVQPATTSPAAVSIAKPATGSVPPNTTGAPISTQTKKPIVRLTPKTNLNPQQQAVTGQGNETGIESQDDIAKLREEVAKMQQVQQMNERREQIKKIIPKELFINKGKFDEKAFEAEVEKRLTSGASDEQLNEFYTLWMDKQKLINAGFGIPTESNSNNPTPEMANNIPAAPTPTGGSAGSYQTPTEVPTGGSAAVDYTTRSITELLSRTFRSVEA